MALSDEELDRYARHIVLPQVGGAGQLKLTAARIAIAGAGGIGAGAIPSLTGAGIGHITLIDDDRVELSNLQRQPLYTSDQVGQRKVDLAARFIGKRNPHVECRTVADRIEADNVDAILSGHDLIIDGTDNFATRLTVSDAAVRLGIPLLSAAAQQFQGQVGLFRGQPCYRCFVGDAFDADDCDSCAELGVLGALTGIVGNFAALIAIRAIVGIAPDPAGTLHLFDGLSLTWKSMKLPRDPGCRTCGEGHEART
ncbi:HesA/MoeB/ThiF family protein [Sphingomonas sp. RB56-2]|uniref:HesA/MoeB/ThiF family protein n=1 Tax=Sphingomonas brevis TaxID=2908206 RepID=A0ABT0S7B5_9SPHN|nr:HesA/MoeB/ThiF family protein [Sphingomonas brevis]MCL6739986.1 HesA/MoeB/ThiF family protein [Sphingomonas brevis]